MEARIRKHTPQISDKYTSEVETDRLEAHFDMAGAALISGISNVVTIRADTLDVTYRGLGISKHVHGLGHAETVNGMTPVEARRRIRTFHLDQIGRVAAKRKAVPEGDGTMLDNTLIIYLSDAAEKHHGSCPRMAVHLIGGGLAGVWWTLPSISGLWSRRSSHHRQPLQHPNARGGKAAGSVRAPGC